MRKSTKKTIMALSIVLIFGLSSVAFVVTSLSGFSGTQQEEVKPLEKFVVDGELNPIIEYDYYQKGFTFLKFYYTDSQYISSYVDKLPELFTTNSDQIQLIVEKIPSNETYIDIINFNNEDRIYNITDEKITDSLCNILISVPLSCLEFDVEDLLSNNSTNSTE